MTDGSAELELVGVQGVWWRQSLAGADPLGWFEPPPDGRWQRGAVTGALYMSESPDTAWSEFFRAAAEQGLPPHLKMPRDLIRLEVDLDGIADLSTAAALGTAGLPWPEPVSRNWPAFQEVGEMLLAQGAGGSSRLRQPERAASTSVCSEAVRGHLGSWSPRWSGSTTRPSRRAAAGNVERHH